MDPEGRSIEVILYFSTAVIQSFGRGCP